LEWIKELSQQISDFGHLENLVREGESIVLEFKPENDVNEKGNENRILRGVVALANTRGGNLVIGIEKIGDKHEIVGTSSNQDFILNWLSQLINSYVDPPDLIFNVYTIEFLEKNKKCICIFVERSVTKHALRHYGRKSQKLGYHLLLRIGDSSREVDFSTFWSVAFNNLMDTLSTIPQRIPSPLHPSDISVELERKFDLNSAVWYLQEINKKYESSVEQRLLDEFRTKLTNLPYASQTIWTEEIKKFVSSLFRFIEEQLRDKKQIYKALDFLHIISHRCDNETLEEIQKRFLGVLETLYEEILENHQLTKAHDLLDLLQTLNNYDITLMNKLLMDAICSWSDEEYGARYNDFEFYHYKDKEVIKELKSKLVSMMSKYKEKGDVSKAERIEKLYDKVRVLL